MKKNLALFSLLILLTLSVSACTKKSVSSSKAESKKELRETTQTSVEEGLQQPVVTSLEDLTNGLKITTPTAGTDFKTGNAWNVIRGVAPAEAVSIEVNGWNLHKFIPNSGNWNYIASTKMQTLAEGENTYVVKAFDVEGNVIAETTYLIDYSADYALPYVGNSLSLVIVMTLLMTTFFLIFSFYFI